MPFYTWSLKMEEMSSNLKGCLKESWTVDITSQFPKLLHEAMVWLTSSVVWGMRKRPLSHTLWDQLAVMKQTRVPYWTLDFCGRLELIRCGALIKLLFLSLEELWELPRSKQWWRDWGGNTEIGIRGGETRAKLMIPKAVQRCNKFLRLFDSSTIETFLATWWH